MLVQLVNEEESLNEDKINMIYNHISSRATQILQGKHRKPQSLNTAAMTMLEGVRMGGFDDEDEEDEDEEGAAFDIKETEFAFGARSKRQIRGSKKRSNSFKLGSRPREMKDQVRKTYRRKSFHGIATVLIVSDDA